MPAPPPSCPVSVDLSGQTAVVTGASRGIGRAIALTLGRAGAHVVCVARSADKLAETVQEITDAGGSAEAAACSVTDGEAVDKLLDEVAERQGRIEIIVNNAGITRDGLMPRMSDEEWDDVINTNLRGTFLFARAASRLMMRSRYGRIINIASISGVMGNAGQTNYSASKAGMIGMTRSLAKELASRNVTVNAVAPGFIESDMTAAMGQLALDEAKKRIPCRRMGRAEEIADTVLFLASSSAGYMTGQTLIVDGGIV